MMKKIAFILSVLLAIVMTGCINDNPGGELPDKLVGMDIQYKYANDREYNVKLASEGLSYRYVSGSKPDKWWGAFPYHHAMLDDGLHVVAWHEVGYDDYITLIIDFEGKKLFGSGIIQGKEVHFQPASVSTLSFQN